MSQTILKISDYLDLGLQGQIGLQTPKIFVFTFENLTVSNFTLQLKLFIVHLNVPDRIEN